MSRAAGNRVSSSLTDKSSLEADTDQALVLFFLKGQFNLKFILKGKKD